jgi:hypothetical protein
MSACNSLRFIILYLDLFQDELKWQNLNLKGREEHFKVFQSLDIEQFKTTQTREMTPSRRPLYSDFAT